MIQAERPGVRWWPFAVGVPLLAGALIAAKVTASGLTTPLASTERAYVSASVAADVAKPLSAPGEAKSTCSTATRAVAVYFCWRTTPAATASAVTITTVAATSSGLARTASQTPGDGPGGRSFHWSSSRTSSSVVASLPAG